MSKLNVAKAVKNNPIYAWSTKPRWGERFYQVCKELGYANLTPTPEMFAEAVFNWQKKQAGLDADGMLGPNSWKKLEPKTRYSLDLGVPLPDWISEMPYGWKPDVPDQPLKNGVTDLLDAKIAEDPSFATALTNAGVFIASQILGNLKKLHKVDRFFASNLVQPLIWAFQGNTGDDWDKILFGLGLFPPLTVAAGAVGIWKGILDDKVMNQHKQVLADEPAHLGKAIYPVVTYPGSPGPTIKAQTIASRGGIVWKHPNGLWVYMKLERKGKPILVCDYQPKKAEMIWGPELPLKYEGDGQFAWRSHKGGF
ncbi:MAG TPA: hypothetical protein PKD86_06865 [Gemmatales bacterium]|nr:hypothetical protein [Gemmatales bacterium]HMP59056.1 hypothetical protein [Gemmatales bacterium]